MHFIATSFYVVVAKFHAYRLRQHIIYVTDGTVADWRLPLTGIARRAVNVGTWLQSTGGSVMLGGLPPMKIWVYPSVSANSQPWTARCGDRYDPQPVKRSCSEWVSSRTFLGHIDISGVSWLCTKLISWVRLWQMVAQLAQVAYTSPWRPAWRHSDVTATRTVNTGFHCPLDADNMPRAGYNDKSVNYMGGWGA